MKNCLIAILLLITLFLMNGRLFSQTSNTQEPRNNWTIGVNVSEKGFGLNAGIFKQINFDYDFTANLSISGVSDNREFEVYDIYGNPIVLDKENRIFLIAGNIGAQRYLFKDEIEGGFIPLIIGGITPALVVTTPYEKGYFEAFKYAHASYAMGGYLGVGMEYIQSSNISLAFNARYLYLPVIGKDVNSLKGKPINNLGGFQLTFSLNFLK
ncbi:MAG: hypothetical protein N2490_01425 [Ignavibacteria bacterium]|nr:hypothetical protein [Ignavibacteria bacterium]